MPKLVGGANSLKVTLVGFNVGFALGTPVGPTMVGIGVGFDVGVGFALGKPVCDWVKS